MNDNWKPGDVAITSYGGGTSMALVVEGRTCTSSHPRRPHWHGMSGGWNHLDDALVTYRRLVVIDPEDREQVERLAHVYFGYDYAGNVDDLQAALREFANPTPPKPEEPNGLGAVVEDERGEHWTRIEGNDLRPWHRGGNFAQQWSALKAVRVLSEGVTP